jgi:site-specific DNA recombinase
MDTVKANGQKRAVIVARVSTQKQAREGLSIETQLEKCREYAERGGFKVVEELKDAISGTVPIAERPAGQRLYKLIGDHAVEAVILYTNDRTARDDYSIEYLLLKDHCYSNGIELHYADSGRDDNTVTGNIVGYIKAQIAAEERRKIAERTMRNKKAKAERGKWVGSGATRYGYKRIGSGKDGYLVIDESQARIVRKVFQWYSNGGTIRGIVKKLNAQREVTKRGKPWGQGQIQDMLSSAEYIGQFHYSGIVTNLPGLAIIDKRLFDDAQIRLERNRELARRNGRHEYLLTGVIRCAYGHTMHGRGRKGASAKLYYYHCKLDSDCQSRYVRADIADDLVWRWLVSTLDDDMIERGLNRIAQRKAAELQPTCVRLAQIEKLIESTDGKIKRLVRDMSNEDDEILRAAVKVEVKNMTKQREGLTKEAETLRASIEQSTVSQEMRDRIKATIKEVRAKLDHTTFAQKRFIINKLEVEVVLREDDAGRWLDVSWGLSANCVSLFVTNGKVHERDRVEVVPLVPCRFVLPLL